MFADQSLQFEFKGIQTCLEQINTEMNTSDSLVTTTFSEINTNLSTISSHLSTQTQYQFLGVSWDILLPAFISILIFMLGYLLNEWLKQRDEKMSRALVRNTILTWADINLPHLYQYAQSIDELAKGISSTPYLSTVPCTPQHVTIDVLSQFSIDRLMDALYIGLPRSVDKTQKKIMFNQYMSCVSLLKEQQKIVVDKYKEYYDLVHEIRNEWDIKWRAYIVNIRQNNMRLTSAPDSPEKRYYQTLGELIRSQFTREVNFAENEKIIEASREYINTESESVVSTDIINTNQVFNDLIVTTIRVHSLKTYSVAFAFTARNIAECAKLFGTTIEFYKRAFNSLEAK